MRMAVERSQTAEDRYMAQVLHLTEELKKVHLYFELEKTETANKLQGMNEVIDGLKNVLAGGL